MWSEAHINQEEKADAFKPVGFLITRFTR